MRLITWVRRLWAVAADELPDNIFRYVLATSSVHQLLLLALTVAVFLIEIVPLELQRRIINNLVKDRPFGRVIILCAIYAGVVLVQGEPSSASTSIADGSESAPCAICAGGSTASSRRRPRLHRRSRHKGSRSR